MATIHMPRLSDSMEDGTIVRWLVEDGAEVAAGDELVEVETDKAVMPYEAEQAGTLRIVAAEGATVAVGAPIAQLLADGEAPQAAVAPDVRSSVVAERPENDAHPGPAAVMAPARGERAPASPLARRIAADLGVDLLALDGSGPNGRIVKRDVLAAQAAAAPASAAPAKVAPAANGSDPDRAPAALAAPAAAPTGGAGKGAVERVTLTRVQQTVARRMAEAKSTQPEFTLAVEVDMDAAVELRARLKATAAGQGAPAPSLNDLVVKAVALALRAHPRANGAYRDGAFETYERVNIGVAVAAADTLLVPVVADADALSLGAVAARTRELAERGRAGALTPPELSGGTFTVSNLGMFGIAAFTAILNAPQAGILAVGAVRETPVVKDGAIVSGRRMTATLTCDHRILYGADAAQFLADVRARLEDPLRLIL